MSPIIVLISDIWPSILMIPVMVILSIYAWRRRDTPGALPLSIACLFAVILATTHVMEFISLELDQKILWINFEYALFLPSVTAITLFILDYANPTRWRNRQILSIFFIVPTVALILQLTNQYHHLVFSDFIFSEVTIPIFGPAGWAFLAYALFLTIINFIVFTNLFIHSAQHRWPIGIMLTAQIIGRVIFYLNFTGIISKNLLISETTFPVIAYAIALFGFQIFDPISMAHQVAIDQLQVGILVLDNQNRIVSINPNARHIFDLEENQIKGRVIFELNPALSGVVFQTNSEQGNVFSFVVKGKMRYFLINNSQLKDWRGTVIGRLLMLTDITAQKHAHEMIVDQQKSLAILQERESLAHEMHDNTGQVLAYLGMQSQALRKLIDDGDYPKASNQLVKITAVIQRAHEDLRIGILNLKADRSVSNSFIDSLDHYLHSYTESVGIHTDLAISSNLSERDFPPGVAVQLIRVIQEALTNVYKHAQARNIRVALTSFDGQVSISLTDDGKGFDQTLDRESGHFGMVFMQQRMAQIGGSMEIHSEIGKGTVVKLVVPITKNEVIE